MSVFICMECHYAGKPLKKKSGSGKLDMLAWLTFPFGLPYIIWQRMRRKNVCKSCGSEFLVLLESPTGQRLWQIEENKLGADIEKLPTSFQDIGGPKTANTQEILLNDKSEKPPQDPNAW